MSRGLLEAALGLAIVVASASGQGLKFLVIDDESIKKDEAPNFFTEEDVNGDVKEIGQRMQLRYFAAHVGDTITLRTGQQGDEGWFSLETVPSSWVAAGPTSDGLRNFFGDPGAPPDYAVGPGLGTPDANGDREALLDEIPDVTPLHTAGLQALIGQRACAVVFDSDISINTSPLTGSLKGSNLGTVAFEVVAVGSPSGSELPDVDIEILDAETLCTDTTDPTISAIVDPPPNQAGVHTSPPTVSFDCQDTGSGIDFCTAPVTVTAEGETTVVGTAIDLAGNSASVNVTIFLEPPDSTPPTISAVIDPPANAAGWHNTGAVVSFDCSDAQTGIVFCTDPLTVTALGETAITGLAQDGNFNVAEVQVTLRIDTIAPVVQAVLSPEPNQAGWNNSDVTVTFQADDPISGIASVSPPETVSTEGAAQPVSGTATDIAGNTGSGAASVNLDKTPPDLTLIGPETGSTLLEPLLTLSGDVSDSLSGPASVQCGAESSVLSASAYTCAVELASGLNTIDVVATDVAGNIATQTLEVTFAPPPSISITSPTEFASFSAGPVVVTGATAADVVQVFVNGVPAQLSGGSFSASVPLNTGLNTITAVATNAADNSGIATVHLTLDDESPFATIDTPVDGAIVNLPSISVSGQVRDTVAPSDGTGALTVTVNGVPAAVSNGRYLASGIALSPGPNVLATQATDAAGNSFTATATVEFQDLSGQPRIEVVSGDLQQATVSTALAQPLVVRSVDAAGAPVAGTSVTFRITRGDGALAADTETGRILTLQTGADGTAEVDFTVGARAGEGGNSVEATAAGFQGVARFSAAGTPGTSVHLHHDAGDNQAGIVGQPLPFPLVVIATDSGHNRLGGVPVTFTVVEGGGNFEGQSSVTINTGPDGVARATFTLGAEEAIAGHSVVADTVGNTGPTVSFTATAQVPGDPAETSVSGVVLDNTNNPVPGVTVSIVETGLAVQTTAQGQFSLQPAPVGEMHLHVDGTTATRPGSWASLEFQMVTVPGRDNTLGMPVYVLPLDWPNGIHVTETLGGTLTIPGMPGFSLEVAPGSATFPDGSREGDVSVTLVHADKVPMTPNFGQQPRMVITVQPPGVHFDPPAKVTYPNLDGNRVGETVELYSFDHDMERFVTSGTAAVSEDGLLVTADAGSGIRKGGWQCAGAGQPPPTGQCENVNVRIVKPTDAVFIGDGSTVQVEADGGPEESIYTWTAAGQGLSIVGPSSGTDLKMITLMKTAQPSTSPLSAEFLPRAQQSTPTITVQVTKDQQSASASLPVAALEIVAPIEVSESEIQDSDVLFITDSDSTRMPLIELKADIPNVNPAKWETRLFTWTIKSLELEAGACGRTNHPSGSGPEETLTSPDFLKVITAIGGKTSFRPETLWGGVMEIDHGCPVISRTESVG